MSHNNFKYRFCLASEQSIREALGYSGGNVSTDSLLVVGDKQDSDMTLGGLTIPTKPSYMGALPDWPFVSHEEALTEIHKQATTENGSDGWCWPVEM